MRRQNQRRAVWLALIFANFLMGVTVVWFRLSFRLVRHVRQHRYDARAFDGDGKIALVLGAHTRHTTGHDFAALGHEFLKGTDILVVNARGFISAELANLATAALWAGTAFFGLPCGKPPFSKLSFAGCSRKIRGMSSDWLSVSAMSCALSPPDRRRAVLCCLAREFYFVGRTSRDMGGRAVLVVVRACSSRPRQPCGLDEIPRARFAKLTTWRDGEIGRAFAFAAASDGDRDGEGATCAVGVTAFPGHGRLR